MLGLITLLYACVRSIPIGDRECRSVLAADDALDMESEEHLPMKHEPIYTKDRKVMAFMNSEAIDTLLNEHFTARNFSSHDLFLSLKDEIYEVAAMDLYGLCEALRYELNEDNTPTPETVETLKAHLAVDNFSTIRIINQGLAETPAEALMFFNDVCSTKYLNLSGSSPLDLELLNTHRLDKIETLILTATGLTSIPPLYNLTNLKYLNLDRNEIKKLTGLSCYDTAYNKYHRMGKILIMTLRHNPIWIYGLDTIDVYSEHLQILLTPEINLTLTRENLETVAKLTKSLFLTKKADEEAEEEGNAETTNPPPPAALPGADGTSTSTRGWCCSDIWFG